MPWLRRRHGLLGPSPEQQASPCGLQHAELLSGDAMTRPDLDAMYERRPLPTQGQINAIGDLKALHALRDEVETVVAKIEADLEFSDGDNGWAARARTALALHRLCDRR